MASTYLSKTITPSNYNRRKFTLSAWVKKAEGSAGASPILGFHGSTDYTMIRVDASSGVEFICYQSSSVVARKQANMKLRDSFGWYHVVVAVDTDNGTASNRNRIYVNGEEQTSWSIDTNASSGLDLINNNQTNFDIGSGVDQGGTRGYFSGILSHVHYCEGYQYSASDFGETDATTGEWKIKTSPSVTYGTNGFFILKDGNSVTDQSGNGNNWTVGAGTLTNTEDNPSNVFCTWNPNYRSARKDMTLTNGNTFIFEQNSGDSGVSGTIGVSSGKWYWEQIIAQVNGTNAAVIGGLHTTEDFNESPTDALSNNTCGLRANGNVYKNGTDLGNFTTANPNGDIFGIAFDADNGSVYFWKNGTALNSGTAIITGLDMTKTWIPFGVQHGGARVTTSTNFGNGYFQTTAVASAGTNASGIGIFEYDVPTGYTALSTKGLNL